MKRIFTQLKKHLDLVVVLVGGLTIGLGITHLQENDYIPDHVLPILEIERGESIKSSVADLECETKEVSYLFFNRWHTQCGEINIHHADFTDLHYISQAFYISEKTAADTGMVSPLTRPLDIHLYNDWFFLSKGFHRHLNSDFDTSRIVVSQPKKKLAITLWHEMFHASQIGTLNIKNHLDDDFEEEKMMMILIESSARGLEKTYFGKYAYKPDAQYIFADYFNFVTEACDNKKIGDVFKTRIWATKAINDYLNKKSDCGAENLMKVELKKVL